MRPLERRFLETIDAYYPHSSERGEKLSVGSTEDGSRWYVEREGGARRLELGSDDVTACVEEDECLAVVVRVLDLLEGPPEEG